MHLHGELPFECNNVVVRGYGSIHVEVTYIVCLNENNVQDISFDVCRTFNKLDEVRIKDKVTKRFTPVREDQVMSGRSKSPTMTT